MFNWFILFIALQVVFLFIGIVGIPIILILGVPPTLSDEEGLIVVRSLIVFYGVSVVLFDILYWTIALAPGWRSKFLARLFLSYIGFGMGALALSFRDSFQYPGGIVSGFIGAALIGIGCWLMFDAIRTFVRGRAALRSPAIPPSGGFGQPKPMNESPGGPRT